MELPALKVTVARARAPLGTTPACGRPSSATARTLAVVARSSLHSGRKPLVTACPWRFAEARRATRKKGVNAPSYELHCSWGRPENIVWHSVLSFIGGIDRVLLNQLARNSSTGYQP